jgi:hypothetical protein
MYVCESIATLVTDKLNYKLQTRPLTREGTTTKNKIKMHLMEIKENSGHGPHRGAGTKTD